MNNGIQPRSLRYFIHFAVGTFTVQAGHKKLFKSNYKTAGLNIMCNFLLWSFPSGPFQHLVKCFLSAGSNERGSLLRVLPSQREIAQFHQHMLTGVLIMTSWGVISLPSS